jgi:DNA repair ATPase RecN
MNSDIVIKVCGTTAVGKSLIVDIIRYALSEYDIKQLSVDKLDEEPITAYQMKRFECANEILKDKTIHLQEVQISRSSLKDNGVDHSIVNTAALFIQQCKSER